ncbi:hypothetical protein, partial [Xanthomonas perforans]|uniref:hypothetical protein n=1 Tax=Xanthomonas perforans TaxID=442694 RepID=UPI001F213D65
AHHGQGQGGAQRAQLGELRGEDVVVGGGHARILVGWLLMRGALAREASAVILDCASLVRHGEHPAAINWSMHTSRC